MNVREAFAAIALAAVACDGRLDRDEAHALRRQLENRSIYSGLSEVEMGDLFDTLLTLLRSSGVHGLITEAIPVLSPGQQESALAVAAHLVHADRMVSPEETSLLQTLATDMVVPTADAEMVIRSIAALNRTELDI